MVELQITQLACTWYYKCQVGNVSFSKPQALFKY